MFKSKEKAKTEWNEKLMSSIEEKFMYNLNTKMNIHHEAVILIGVSGGPDSLALLHLFLEAQKEKDFLLKVIHVDHMIRGDASGKDAFFVKEHCASLNIPIEIVQEDIQKRAKENKQTLEEAAREARYEVFHREADKYPFAKIALGHHMEDQAETVLLNLFRGSGLRGLGGIRFNRGRIIRPILDCTRKEIESYLEKKHLIPRMDASNMELQYTRNRIRWEILPMLKNCFNKDVANQLWNLSQIAQEDEDFLEDLTQKKYQELCIDENLYEIRIHRKAFVNENAVLRKRLIRYIVLKLRGNLMGIEKLHVEAFEKFILKAQTGKIFKIIKNLQVMNAFHSINFQIPKKEFVEEEKNDNKAYVLTLAKTHFVPNYGKLTLVLKNAGTVCLHTDHADESSNVDDNKRLKTTAIETFDYQKILESQLPLQFRYKEPGDYIKISSLGRKSLKKYFIEKKIDREQRGKMGLLTLGSEVLWVIGIDTHHGYRVHQNTQKVLWVYVEKF